MTVWHSELLIAPPLDKLLRFFRQAQDQEDLGLQIKFRNAR